MHLTFFIGEIVLLIIIQVLLPCINTTAQSKDAECDPRVVSVRYSYSDSDFFDHNKFILTIINL